MIAPAGAPRPLPPAGRAQPPGPCARTRAAKLEAGAPRRCPGPRAVRVVPIRRARSPGGPGSTRLRGGPVPPPTTLHAEAQRGPAATSVAGALSSEIFISLGSRAVCAGGGGGGRASR